MKKFLDKLKDKTFKDSILTLSANTISQIFSFLVTIIISRSLSLAEYGLYSIVNNITSFVSDLADLGMNSSITRFVAKFHKNDKKDDEQNIIIYSIRKKAFSLSIVLILLILFSQPIAKYMLHDSNLSYFIYFIFLSCVFSLFVGAMRAILQGRQEFEKYFIAMVLWNVVWAGCIIIFFLFNELNIFSSLIAGTISGGINLLLCFKLTNIRLKSIIKKPTLTAELRSSFNNFGNWMVLWSICALLQSKADIFLLASLTTAEQVSYYDIASKILKPILMVVASYAQVLNPVFAALDSKKLIEDKLRKVIKVVSLISVLILIGIFLVNPAINIVFGTKYTDSIIPAQLLLFAIIFYVWTIPYNSALYALNKPYIFTIAAFIGLIATIIGDFLLLKRFGAIGAAMTYIIAQIVGFLVAFIAYRIILKKEEV